MRTAGMNPFGLHRSPARRVNSFFQSSSSCELELILRCKLQLAHRSGTPDAAEGGRGEVQSWIVPVRVVERIECLKADRQLVLLVVRHVEGLV